MKLLATTCLLFSLPTFAGVMTNGNESVEFKIKEDDKYYTQYCKEKSCIESDFSSLDFSLILDDVVYFIERMYSDKEFYAKHINDSYKIYQESGKSAWILDFAGVLTFSVKDDEYQDVLKANEKLLPVLYSFHGRIHSEEAMDKFKEFYASPEKLKSYNNADFNFYKTVSKLIINKVKENNV